MAHRVSEAQELACASNFKQVGLVLNMFAGDNNQYFPRDDIPATMGPNPNLWHEDSIRDMADYGFGDTRVWFCPTRGYEGKVTHDNNANDFHNEVEDMINELQFWGGFAANMPNNFWIPRKTGNRWIPYENGSDATDIWPTGLTHEAVNERPIYTDWVFDRASNSTAHHPSLAYGGHNMGGPAYGGTMQGINRLYADGHVEYARASELVENFVMSNWINYW